MPNDRMSAQPDVLLIILDTLRRDHLSLYGYGRETSPCLDAFAADAAVFERAVAPAQWTVPSHASIFTGLYPSRHSLTQADARLSPSHRTLAEILQVAGYHTVGFSNNPLVGVLANGLTRGFDAFYNYAGAVPNRPVDRRRGAWQRGFATRFRRRAGHISNRFAQHDALFRWSLNPRLFPFLSRLVHYKGDTRRSLDDFFAYRQAHHAGGGGQPLFAFLNLMGAHTPYRPPQETLARIAPALSRDRRAFRFIREFNGSPLRWASPLDAPLEGWQQQALAAFYDAEIAHQDRLLGALLKRLRDSGALEHTLLIIAADHGEGHGDHRFFGHGFVVYQELVHVPLLIHFPPRFPAGRSRRNVSTRRLFHTILDIAGLKPPLVGGDVARLCLSQSLNGADPEADCAYAEAVPPQLFLRVLQHRSPHHIAALQLQQTRRGMYQGDHKLALLGEAVEGLFDIASDPAEEKDIRAAQPATAAAMQAALLEFSARANPQHSPPADATSPEVADSLRQLGYFD